jgi:hypothetical protein
MKKLFLAGVVALLMATSAHASWQCGEVAVNGGGKLTSDHFTEYSFQGLEQNLFKKEKLTFEFDKKGAKLNGKRCKEVK